MAELRLIAIDRRGLQNEPAARLSAPARAICSSLVKLYESSGYQPPWIGYLAFSGDTCVGTCGFKSAPAANRVEIAYHTFEEFEGQGVATRMAELLLAIALDANPGIEITAQTLPRRNASNSILRRLGFEFWRLVDHPEDGEVWEWIYEPKDPA
jgi:RimJ/RimL family protein N-acetyltransferase